MRITNARAVTVIATPSTLNLVPQMHENLVVQPSKQSCNSLHRALENQLFMKTAIQEAARWELLLGAKTELEVPEAADI